MHWVTCTQTMYFPSIYMMERFARCHTVVWMEEAQFHRKKHMSWTKLVGPNGAFRSVVPLRKHNQRARLCDVYISDPKDWFIKATNQIRGNYGKQKAYKELAASFEYMLSRAVSSERLVLLNDLGRATTEWLKFVLGLDFEIVLSRSLVDPRLEDPTEWVAELADCADATDYVQGIDSMEAYFIRDVFASRGIPVWGQKFNVPEYEQRSKEFDSSVSMLDALFMCGVHDAKALIKADQPKGHVVGTMVRWE